MSTEHFKNEVSDFHSFSPDGLALSAFLLSFPPNKAELLNVARRSLLRGSAIAVGACGACAREGGGSVPQGHVLGSLAFAFPRIVNTCRLVVHRHSFLLLQLSLSLSTSSPSPSMVSNVDVISCIFIFSFVRSTACSPLVLRSPPEV